MALTRSIKILRGCQFGCSLIATIFNIYLTVAASSDYYSSSSSLCLAAAWATSDMAVISALSAIFIKRPHDEMWGLVLTMDTIAVLCGIAGLACICVGGTWFWTYIWVAPIALMIVVLFAFFATAILTYRAHREHVGKTRPSDPLKPYLVKREIDVWCYPVQHENSQPTKQYVLASDDIERAIPAPALAPADEAKALPQPQQSIPPASIAETTAQWSVPSGNETYRMSIVAPSTALPSYRGPPSIAHTLEMNIR